MIGSVWPFHLDLPISGASPYQVVIYIILHFLPGFRDGRTKDQGIKMPAVVIRQLFCDLSNLDFIPGMWILLFHRGYFIFEDQFDIDEGPGGQDILTG
jgi:hypothetical protein